jgi:hypothetical protein
MNKILIFIALIGAISSLDISRDLQRATASSPHCSLKVSSNGRCGSKYGNTRCAGKREGAVSCSRWSWCGTSPLHKKTNQVKYQSHKCGAAKVTPTGLRACLKMSKNGRCGRKYGSTQCGTSTKVFCSRWNWCGTSRLHKNGSQKKFNGHACRGAAKKGKKLIKKVFLKVAKKAVKKVVKAKKAIKKVVKAKKAVKKVVRAIKTKKVLKAKKAVKKVVKKVVKAKKAVKKVVRAIKTKKVVKKAIKAKKVVKKAIKTKKVVKKAIKKVFKTKKFIKKVVKAKKAVKKVVT